MNDKPARYEAREIDGLYFVVLIGTTETVSHGTADKARAEKVAAAFNRVYQP